MTPCPSCSQPGDAASCDSCGAMRRCGDYTCDAVLAARTHGRTYRGKAPDGTRVAIKELVFSAAPSASVVDALEREGRLLSQFSHPQIPRIVATFWSGEGAQRRFFLVEQFFEGDSLKDRAGGGPLPAGQVERVVRQALAVLVFLQRQTPPIYHRDLKPANLLLGSNGQLRIVDFGAARTASSRQLDATVVGTVGYAPPEQMAGVVDPTSDVYALGVTAIELLTGKTPIDLLRETGELAVPALPVDARFDAVLRRMTARRKARFPGPADALQALDRRPVPVAAYAGVAAFLLLAGAVGFWATRPPGAAVAARPGPETGAYTVSCVDGAVATQLQVTADDQYRLWVGGELIDDQERQWMSPQRYALTLRSGLNLIAIEAKNRWNTYGLDRGLIADLTLDPSTHVMTDASWRAAAPVGEAWTSPGFDDTGWATAVELGSHGIRPWGPVFGQSAAHWVWSYRPDKVPRRPTEETVAFRKVFVIECR